MKQTPARPGLGSWFRTEWALGLARLQAGRWRARRRRETGVGYSAWAGEQEQGRDWRRAIGKGRRMLANASSVGYGPAYIRPGSGDSPRAPCAFRRAANSLESRARREKATERGRNAAGQPLDEAIPRRAERDPGSAGWLAECVERRNLVVRVRACGCRYDGYGGRGGGQRSRQRPAVFQAPENTESDSPLPHGSCLSAAQFAAPRPGLCLQALPDPHPALRSHSPLHRPPCRPRGLQPAGRR